MRKIAYHTGIIAILCLLVAFFYSNRVFSSGVNEREDVCVQDIPHASFFVNTLKEDAIPLWNPYKICGLPFFEASFMGPYYPFVFLYLLLPISKAVNAGFVIHILLSGIFMFVLSRELKFSKVVSLFCALSWMLSSVFQQYSESGWLPETITACYLPLLIYVFIRIKRSGKEWKIPLSLLAGLILGLIILGGHPCYVVISVYSFVIFALASCVKEKKYLLYLFVILFTAVLLSSITWGPLLIQAKKGGALEGISGKEYEIHELRKFLFPTDIRDGFAGKLVFVLGLIGVFLKKTPFRINFILMLCFSLFFMTADIEIGNFNLLNLFPLANQVRFLWTWHISFIFSLIIFAGFTLEKLSFKLIHAKKMLWVILSLVLGLQLADLYYFNKKFYPRKFNFRVKEYFPDYPVFNFFKGDHSLFRVSNRFYDFPLFRLNQGMIEGINCFESRIKGINLSKVRGPGHLAVRFKESPPTKLMDICNIKYVITPAELDPNHYTQQFVEKNPIDETAVYLYRNDSCFPRAFLLDDVDKDNAERVLLDNYKSPLLQLEISDEVYNMLANYRDVDIEWSPNTYAVSLECKSNSFLFLSEMYDDGWKATLDGSPVRIYSPFNFFMGVFLPPGKHLLKLRFEPLFFYVFSTISVTVFFALTCIILYCTFKYSLLARRNNAVRINNEKPQ